jgi:hypothetical protein
VQSNDGGRLITVLGDDEVGAMYGGLDIAEAIRLGTLESLKDSDNKPHIARRGIKFNIPLDLRTPSYTDCSDAAQANIPEVWEKRLLDQLPRFDGSQSLQRTLAVEPPSIPVDGESARVS